MGKTTDARRQSIARSGNACSRYCRGAARGEYGRGISTFQYLHTSGDNGCRWGAHFFKNSRRECKWGHPCSGQPPKKLNLETRRAGREGPPIDWPKAGTPSIWWVGESGDESHALQRKRPPIDWPKAGTPLIWWVGQSSDQSHALQRGRSD